MTKNPIMADTFDVWGHPPKALTRDLTPKQIRAIKRYTDHVVARCYPIAFQAGRDRGQQDMMSIDDQIAVAQVSR